MKKERIAAVEALITRNNAWRDLLNDRIEDLIAMRDGMLKERDTLRDELAQLLRVSANG